MRGQGRMVGLSCGALLLAVMLGASPGLGASLIGSAGDFALLGLNGGTVTVNSATTIVGDFGYSRLVTSGTNQKAENFTGTVYVHSLASFAYTAKNFAPSGGILFGSTTPGVDAKLDAANADALAASAAFAGLAPTHVLGVLGDNDNRTVNSTGPLNVVSITSLDYKSDTLSFVSRPGFQDVFIVNVQNGFEFSQSTITLTGLPSNNVIFNFPNASDIKINKSASTFNGTILAPLGTVDYHNPAAFSGSIIALNIDLHSDFNLLFAPPPPPPPPIPEPATLAGSLVGLSGITMAVRRRFRKA